MRRTTLRVTLWLVALASPQVFAAGDSGPALRQGLWRFERTFEYADGRASGEPLTSEQCADPLALGDEQLAMMRKLGCSAERTRAGVAEWRHRVTCDRPGLPKGSSTSVQTVLSPDAYEVRVVNEGELALTVLSERLVARRVGDC